MIKEIEIGGEKRPICYNNNALEEFEEMTGLSVLDGLNLKKIGHLKALAFCGLKHGFLEKSDYKGDFPHSLQDVGRWFDMSKTPAIFEAFRNDTSGDNEATVEVDAGKKSGGVTSGV